MTLGEKIKDLNKKGFEVRFKGMPSGNIYISIYGNYLQRATVCIHSCQISHDDCGLDELFERSLGFVERDYLDFYSCENCARNKDYGGCPKSYLCFDTFTKLAFKKKEDVKEEYNNDYD